MAEEGFLSYLSYHVHMVAAATFAWYYGYPARLALHNESGEIKF